MKTDDLDAVLRPGDFLEEEESAMFRRAVRAIPGLRPILAIHVVYNEGVLPNMLLSDFAIYATSLFERSGAGDAGAAAELEQILAFLEVEYAGGSDRLKNQIGTGFLESLPNPLDPKARIRLLLGPLLRKAAETWWGSDLPGPKRTGRR